MSDSFFKIGSTHKICQDYANHIEKDDINIGVVSDGCSSVEDSDFGSRILAKCAEKYLLQNDIEISCIQSISKEALNIIELIGLSQISLAATLLMAKKSKGKIDVLLCGDGMIVGKKRGMNEFFVSLNESPFSAPYYPVYAAVADFEKKYLDNVKVRTEKLWNFSENESLLIRESSLDPKIPSVYSFYEEEYEFIAIITDGITSFLERSCTQTSISSSRILWEKPLLEIMAFKTFNGEFIRRRFQMAEKKWQSMSWQHADDIGIAVITF